MEYVSIERHFRRPDKDPQHPITRRMFGEWHKTLTWDTLVAPDATQNVVALVAPSGMGKTTELKTQATRLRQNGRFAVFAEARAVADHGFDQAALDRHEWEAYREWVTAGDEKAVVFVDGIDELPLVNKDIKTLARRLGHALPPSTRHWQLVITSRTSAWSARAATLLRDALRDPDGTDDLNLGKVTFEPLDESAVQMLAEATPCNDTAAFMRAFHEAELDRMVALRPMDIAPLVEHWNRNGQIPSWAQILQDYQDGSLAEPRADREYHRQLTLDAARAGARRLGAATLFTQKTFMALPSGAHELAATVSTRELFVDWRPQALQELLESPLFVHKGTDAVQFPHGSLGSYLAALWLADRSRSGKNEEWLRDQLLVRIWDEQEHVLPGSRRETAGWLASFVPAFRRLLVGPYPEIVLYEGDPERLTSTEIQHTLKILLELVREHAGTPGPTRGTLQKLARPDLEQEIVQLLNTEANGFAKQHLLRWAEAGRYRSAIPMAHRTAVCNSTPSPTRVAAVRVIAACGTCQRV